MCFGTTTISIKILRINMKTHAYIRKKHYPVWYTILNTCFQFLNIIICIFIHFFTYTYFQKTENCCLNTRTKQILRVRLVHVFKNWKLLFKIFYRNTCRWKSVWTYVKYCLKTENYYLETLTKHPLSLLFLDLSFFFSFFFFFFMNEKQNFPNTKRCILYTKECYRAA